MKNVLKLGILAIAFLFSFNNAAEAQKIGYLNSDAILAVMPEVKQMQSRLDGLRTQLTKKGQAMLTDYQKIEQDAIKKKENKLLSPAEEEKIIADLQKKQTELAKYDQDMQEKLAKKQNELLQPILDKVNKAIQDVAKENGYQFILNASTGSLLYADESADISELVKKKLGL